MPGKKAAAEPFDLGEKIVLIFSGFDQRSSNICLRLDINIPGVDLKLSQSSRGAYKHFLVEKTPSGCERSVKLKCYIPSRTFAPLSCCVTRIFVHDRALFDFQTPAEREASALSNCSQLFSAKSNESIRMLLISAVQMVKTTLSCKIFCARCNAVQTIKSCSKLKAFVQMLRSSNETLAPLQSFSTNFCQHSKSYAA